jgi:hypothetical protein
MRGSAGLAVTAMIALEGLLCGCSDGHPLPTGPVSTPDAGKAAFNEAKAIEKIYHAGYTNITLRGRDPGGGWHGQATRRNSGVQTTVSVTAQGPVVVR